jgi:hypothetical protein
VILGALVTVAAAVELMDPERARALVDAGAVVLDTRSTAAYLWGTSRARCRQAGGSAS